MNIFEECKLYCYDQYWRNILNCCKNNIFPVELYYNKTNNVLSVLKPQVINFQLTNDPKIDYNTIIYIFKTYLNCQSPYDSFYSLIGQIKKDKKLQRLQTKSFKDQLLINYSKNITIDDDNAKNLYNYIKLELQLKNITSSDINYTENEIISINLLKDKDITRRKKVDISSIPTSSCIQKKNNVHKYMDVWLKNLKQKHI